MYKVAVVLIASVLPADAEEWRALKGDEIGQALSGVTLEYETGWQDFRASGRTLYNAGADSWGYWAVREDRYCSQWPPSDGWDCYAVEAEVDGARFRFVGAAGDITIGRLREAQ